MRLWPDLSYYPGICLEELKKTTGHLSHDSRFPGRDLNTEPPTFEGCELLGHDVRSVTLLILISRFFLLECLNKKVFNDRQNSSRFLTTSL
jgi:hypothetical protein